MTTDKIKLKRTTDGPIYFIDSAGALTLKPTNPLRTTGAGCDPYAQLADPKPNRRRSKLDEMRALSKKIKR